MKRPLSEIGEREAIRILTAHITPNTNVKTGPGDDCAVVQIEDTSGTELLLTSDPLIQNVHFTVDTPPNAIGHKAVARVLSDIAAMGGNPAWALINIVAPPSCDIEFLSSITKSAYAVADRYSLSIVGGDLARSDKIELHVFAVGTVPKGQAVLRSGGMPDDTIYVTGTLGGSRAGKHCSFEPLIKEGLFLRNWATAMIDISDGLATDLRHIAEMSHVGAIITAAQIPLSSTVSSFQNALTDGEDFELLFTVPENKRDKFEAAFRENLSTQITAIGRLTDKADVIEIINDKGNISILNNKGFQHF